MSSYCSYAQTYLHEHRPPIAVDIMELAEFAGTVFITLRSSDLADAKESTVHEFVEWINATTKHLNSLPLAAQYVFHLEPV